MFFLSSTTGILKAISKTYYKTNLNIELKLKDTVEVANRNGVRHHVVFSLWTGKVKQEVVENDPPPTFVAQTRKNCEIQIHKKVSVFST